MIKLRIIVSEFLNLSVGTREVEEVEVVTKIVLVCCNQQLPAGQAGRQGVSLSLSLIVEFGGGTRVCAEYLHSESAELRPSRGGVGRTEPSW